MNAPSETLREELAILAIPRACGSAGELHAQRWVQGALTELGLEVREDPFRYDPRPARRGASLLAAAVAIAFALAATNPGLAWVAWTAVALAVATGVVLGGGTPRVDRRPVLPARNLIAGDPAGRPPAWVVLAHVDTKSQRWSFAARSSLVAAAAVGVLFWAGVLCTPAPPALARALAAAIASVALLITFLGSGNQSPGALDNATGLLTLVEFARRHAARGSTAPPIEWVVTTAEEDGLVGAHRYFERHAARLLEAGARVINIDTLGGSGPFLLTGHRLPRSAPADRALLEAFERTARRLGLGVQRKIVPAPAAVDSAMATRYGLPALTLASGGVRDTFRFVHRPSDTIDRVDVGQVLRAVDLLDGVITGERGGAAWRAGV